MSNKTTFEQQILELKKRLEEHPENTVDILKGWIVHIQNEEIANLSDLTNDLKRRISRLACMQTANYDGAGHAIPPAFST